MSSRLMPPKVGSSSWQTLDNFVRVVAVEFDVEDIHIGKAFEQDALPSITGLPASAPMLPRPRTAVPLVTTADQVAARGVVESFLRIVVDLQARFGDARGVGQAQIALRAARLGGR